MKYHKIRGVEKSVCTCEQMVAYNVCFANYSRYRDEYFSKKDITTRAEVCSFLSALHDYMIHFYLIDCTDNKYDIDAISNALRNGLETYLNKPFIARDYEEVGRVFKADYLNV